MSRLARILTVLVVATVGILGCARNPGATTSNQAERIRTLEARCARLEEDYRGAAGDRDKARKQAANLEEERAQLEIKVAELRKDADLAQTLASDVAALRKQLDNRTAERDAAQASLNALVSSIQQAIGKAQVQIAPPAGPSPVTSTPATGDAGQS